MATRSLLKRKGLLGRKISIKSSLSLSGAKRKRHRLGLTAAERKRRDRRLSSVYLSNNYNRPHSERFDERGGYPAFFDLSVAEYKAHKEIHLGQECVVATKDCNDLIVVTRHRLVGKTRRPHPHREKGTVVVFYGPQIGDAERMTQSDASKRYPAFFDCNGNYKRKSVHWEK